MTVEYGAKLQWKLWWVVWRVLDGDAIIATGATTEGMDAAERDAAEYLSAIETGIGLGL